MDALGINLPGLITQIVSFIILFVILSKLLYKPLVGMLDQRAEKIKEGLEASERARDDASKAEEAITQQLDEARLEGQKLISQARETAEKFRKDEMEVATSDIENMKLKAEKDIQRERDAAIEDLRKEFADLVITAAEKVVTNSLDEKEHRKLIENVLEESSSLNNREKKAKSGITLLFSETAIKPLNPMKNTIGMIIKNEKVRLFFSTLLSFAAYTLCQFPW